MEVAAEVVVEMNKVGMAFRRGIAEPRLTDSLWQLLFKTRRAIPCALFTIFRRQSDSFKVFHGRSAASNLVNPCLSWLI